MRTLAALVLAPAALLGLGLLAPVEIREWQVPWEDTRPRDPYVDGENRVWFVGQRADYIAYLEPATGEFERYELDSGTGPHNLIVDDAGMIWYAGNRAAHIGKLDPETGAITKFPMPDPDARDPHTLIFNSEGDIWFTVQGGNFVGKLATETGDVQLVRVPTPRARPYGIIVDSDDRPWIAEVGTNRIGTIDPATMEYEEIVIEREDARPRRIAVTSDDVIWYVDYADGYLGRLDPETRQIREWRTPAGGDSRPYAMAADDRDRLWFVETGMEPNRLVGFDPKTAEFFSITDVPSGGGTVRHMVFEPSTRSIWFGTDTNTIGRAEIP